jgi:hypothetical protein
MESNDRGHTAGNLDGNLREAFVTPDEDAFGAGIPARDVLTAEETT